MTRIFTQQLESVDRSTLAASRVLVVGDAMLDRYWHGPVDRISPEAPVPVVRITRTEEGTLAPAFWAHSEGEGQPVMQFVRGGWDNLGDLPRPSVQKVEYWVRQGRLERRTYAQLDGAAGDDPAALLDHVEDVALRFRDAQGQWREDWTPTQPDLLPRAVEMSIKRTGEPLVTLRFLVAPGPLEKPVEGAVPNG